MDVEKIIREYIPEVVHMSLATAKGDTPWICEVHFAYDPDLNLYFRSLATRRHSQEIAKNPKVAGNIIKQHSLEDSAVGVYFEGTAKMLEAGPEQNKAAECLKERLKLDEDILEEAKQEDGHQFFQVTVESFYAFGRFGGPHGKKYELKWNGGRK